MKYEIKMIRETYTKIRQYIPKYIRQMIPMKKIKKGRWNNNKNISQIRSTIDNTNVDHRGPSGTGKIDNTNIKK
jgi:hypothetical protein